MSFDRINTAVYIASASSLENSELYNKAYAGVCDDRRKKVDAFKLAKDRRLSLAAEVLLRHALKSAGYDGTPSGFKYGENGKPYLSGTDIHFNISHSGDFAVCAVSKAEVGCDIEKEETPNLKVAKRFFSADEYVDIIAESTLKRQRELFFRYWTLKESFVKATGLGMKMPLDAFSVTLDGAVSVRQTHDKKDYAFAEYDGIAGYKCAVCIADKECVAEFCTVNLFDLI